MEYSQDGMKLTESFEGCRLAAYQDQVGVYTIGWGHTADVGPGDTCTYAEAVQFLQDDISEIADQINRHVSVPLTQGEFDALVDFGFNLGWHALNTSTLWRKLKSGDYEGAAAEFPKWDHAGGKEVEGLLRRRLAEQAEFQGGA